MRLSFLLRYDIGMKNEGLGRQYGADEILL